MKPEEIKRLIVERISDEKLSIREIAKQHGFEERSQEDKRRSFELAASKPRRNS